ncbi:MAG: hypothetical protein ACP5IJ_02295 [Candidatus Nanoarchaeia archaeon]
MAIESSIFGFVLCLAATLVLLRYAAISHQVQKQINIIAAGLMFYIIALAWNISIFEAKLNSAITTWLTFAIEAVGFAMIFAGAIWSALELLKK